VNLCSPSATEILRVIGAEYTVSRFPLRLAVNAGRSGVPRRQPVGLEESLLFADMAVPMTRENSLPGYSRIQGALKNVGHRVGTHAAQLWGRTPSFDTLLVS